MSLKQIKWNIFKLTKERKRKHQEYWILVYFTDQNYRKNVCELWELHVPEVHTHEKMSIVRNHVIWYCVEIFLNIFFVFFLFQVLRYCDHLHGKWYFSEIRAIFVITFTGNGTSRRFGLFFREDTFCRIRPSKYSWHQEVSWYKSIESKLHEKL